MNNTNITEAYNNLPTVLSFDDIQKFMDMIQDKINTIYEKNNSIFKPDIDYDTIFNGCLIGGEESEENYGWLLLNIDDRRNYLNDELCDIIDEIRDIIVDGLQQKCDSSTMALISMFPSSPLILDIDGLFLLDNMNLTSLDFPLSLKEKDVFKEKSELILKERLADFYQNLKPDTDIETER